MFFLLLESAIKEWKKDFMELAKLPILMVKNGIITCISYVNENKKLHRNTDIGPAMIIYDYDGMVELKTYWVNGEYHRPTEEGPAHIEYYDTGKISSEEYWVNGKLHRPLEEGPAMILYDEFGQIKSEHYWVNDKRIKIVKII